MVVYDIYAAGATRNVSVDESLQWRLVAKEYLENCNTNYTVNVFVPEQHFNYTNKQPTTNKQCNSLFLHRVVKSKLLLVNLDNSSDSPGTCMEVQKASDSNIPIIGFGRENTYDWAVEECDCVLDDLEKALKYIVEHYLN